MRIGNLIRDNESIITKLLIGVITILLVVGVSLNARLLGVSDKNEAEILINEAEKEFLLNMEAEKSTRDVQAFEEAYLEVLSNLKKNAPSKENTLNIGRVNYYLGYNRLLNGDFNEAIKFFEDALINFEQTTYYFYILNTRLDLMNIYFRKVNYIDALKNANAIYTILRQKDIEGISAGGQEEIEMQVLPGLVTTASNFGMKNVSEEFYRELVDLTEENGKEKDRMATYAKYQYNINNRNIEDAKKYALKYTEFYKDKDEKSKANANIYILETLIVDKDIEEAEKMLSNVAEAVYEFNEPVSKGYINKLIGMYYEAIDDYDNALKYYVESIRIFEEEELYSYCTDINDKAIRLHDKTEMDLDHFIGKATFYEEHYKYVDELSALADSLVKVDLEKLEKENDSMIKQMKKAEKLNEISKKLNILYFFIIASLVLITKILKNEIRKRKSKEEELKKIINIDYLTKSYSKQYIHKRLECLKEDKEKFSVCIIDIDNFKKINDTYGHNFGDEVLFKTVDVIKDDIQDDGIIGRFGGEEFILIFKDTVELKDIPKRIKDCLKNIKLSIEGVNVTVSGGAKRYNGEEITPLISEIDSLLYKAKSEGKDRILLN
ncbi:GGDEF domain-containing protein [Clostridium sp. LP20]|uniref:GGDEF domain-containing protein n=1 Tax=Clostridium sp. LP20 TaxID=3418665 RepID=UPI003EE46F94